MFTVTVFLSNIILPRNSDTLFKVIGIAILVISAPLMFAPFFYLKKHGRVPTGKAYHETTQVVEIGLYRLIRHPQYLGYILLVTGFAIMSFKLITTALALFAILFFYLQAVTEEEQCKQTLGQQYQDYLNRVPRFNIIIGVFRLLQNRNSA